MNRTEFEQMNKEMQPFLVDGKLTLESESQWLRFKGIIAFYPDGKTWFIILEKAPLFQKHADMITSLYWWRGKIKRGEIKTNELNSTEQSNF